MPLTEQQQTAVVHRGSSLLVSASAGSGKTQVLAQRCVELIADPRQPCDVDRLAVVTFTRAAAAELRERVARLLRARAAEETDSDRQRRLREQELLVESAEIGTIDGWCARIVRQNYERADVDPGFSILAEEPARLLRRQVLEELFAWVYSAADPRAAAARDWVRATAAAQDEFLRGLVAELSSYREHLVSPETWLAAQLQVHTVEEHAPQLAQDGLAQVVQRELRLQREAIDQLTGGAASGPVADYMLALDRWDRELEDSARIRAVSEEIEKYRVPRAGKGGRAPGRSEATEWHRRRLRERWGARRIAGMIDRAGLASRRVATLLRLEAEYERRLQAAKRSAGTYEFADVLRLALRVLGDATESGDLMPSELARRLRARYEHVLVDEFQDTSPVQIAIIRLLTRDEPGRTNGFFVGDVKQSIYGFRQAEPALFTELLDDFESGRRPGRALSLADNFRSHADLLNPLNDVFAALLDRRLGGADYRERERLVPRRDELPNPSLDGQDRVDLIVVEEPGEHSRHQSEEAAPDDDVDDLDRIEREAILAAGHIRALLAAGVQVLDRADNRPVLRLLRLGDIVVLLRSAKVNARMVARTLRQEGVPALTIGKDVVLDTTEVNDLRAVLGLLANRREDLLLAAYLRGPFVGIDERGLLELRQAAPHEFHRAVDEYSKTGSDPGLQARVAAALQRLEEWRQADRELELPQLLRRIIRDTDYELFVRGLPAGAHRAATLAAFVGMSEHFAAADSVGAAEFVQHLEALDAAALDPAIAIPSDEDAVRVMTIHASKGLEFPVVFLLNAGARFNLAVTRAALQADAQTGVGIRVAEYSARGEVWSWQHAVIRDIAQERERSEELRLLYVAATRAREKLYVIGHARSNSDVRPPPRGQVLPLIPRLTAGSPLAWLLMAAGRGVSVTCCPATDIQPAAAFASRPGAAGSPRPVAAPPWTSADEQWLQRSTALLEQKVFSAAAVLPAVLSVSALKNLARRDHQPEAATTRDGRFRSLAAPRWLAASGETDSRARGSAAHIFLEHVDLAALREADRLRAQLELLTSRGRLTAEQAAMVPLPDIAWFGSTDLGQTLALNAELCGREVPFVYAAPVLDGAERMIVRGVIDCVLRSPDGLVLVDYKTDQVGGAELAERYETYSVQLRHYAAAAAAAFARPVVRAALVFLHAREVREVAGGPPAACDA